MITILISVVVAAVLSGVVFYTVGYLRGVSKTNNHFYNKYNELNSRFFTQYGKTARLYSMLKCKRREVIALEQELKWMRECNQELFKAGFREGSEIRLSRSHIGADGKVTEQ